jgi:DNA invertase Pin-like site-specific DNA recombinase
MRKHTAVYVRVSTKGQNLEAQLPDLIAWCGQQGLQVPPDDGWLQRLEVWSGAGIAFYPDKFTGRTMARPGMNRLTAEIEAGRVQRLVIWRLDRLGRTASGLTRFFDQCCLKQTQVLSLRDGFDLDTPVGRFIGQILASVAEFELEIRRDRIESGLNSNRQKSVRAHQMHKAGKPLPTIAVELGLTRQEVERVLAKPPGRLWYGGRAKGSGMVEDCTTDRVVELARRGLRVREIARATGASVRTTYRRLREAKTSVSA